MREPQHRSALQHLLSQTAAAASEQSRLSRLLLDLEQLAAKGIGEKLNEYAHAGASIEDLTAELRMGLAVSSVTGLPIEFQRGEAADLRLRGKGLDCTIEVEHKSSASAFSAVFYPTPEDLAAYARAAEGWKLATCRLHAAVAASPFEIHPWVDAALSEPHWSGQERTQQETDCGAVASWLAEELGRARAGDGTELTHPSAHFCLVPLDAAPGRITGHGPLNAFLLHEHATQGDSRLSLSEWFAKAIQKKSATVARYPERRGALHLIGLVVDEAFACTGHVLASTFLGGLSAESGPGEGARVYRGVPESGRQLVTRAKARGRDDLLRRMQFDCGERVRGDNGLVFDQRVREHADGILGLYYTEGLQFLPNPFTANAIETVCSLFPATLEPHATWQTSTE